ncbi:MAG: hypothetical protein KDN18_14035 [Verrucomicrobiae bacterium]|nr:hypothetical protein [Verrucomicrobiae bacterium]
MSPEEEAKMAEIIRSCAHRLVALEGQTTQLARILHATRLVSDASEKTLGSLLSILAAQSEPEETRAEFIGQYLRIFQDSKRENIQLALEEYENSNPSEAAKLSEILGDLCS